MQTLSWLSAPSPEVRSLEVPRPKAVLGKPPIETETKPAEGEPFELTTPKELLYLQQLAEEEGTQLGEKDFILLTSSSLLAMMPKEDRILRTTFVQEYLYDFDAVAAATRCGFSDSGRGMLSHSPAQNAARMLMSEPVVQRLIKEYSTSMAQDLDPTRVKSLILREAANYGMTGSAASRQNSQKLLAEMVNATGKKKEDEGAVRGGVMAIPASFATDADWEKVARPMQASLKESVGA